MASCGRLPMDSYSFTVYGNAKIHKMFITWHQKWFWSLHLISSFMTTVQEVTPLQLIPLNFIEAHSYA